MSKDIHLEINFEQYISRKLSELSNSGWQISKNDEGFNPDTALYLDDFIQYVTMVCPEKIEKMQKDLGESWKVNLILQDISGTRSVRKKTGSVYSMILFLKRLRKRKMQPED